MIKKRNECRIPFFIFLFQGKVDNGTIKFLLKERISFTPSFLLLFFVFLFDDFVFDFMLVNGNWVDKEKESIRNDYVVFYLLFFFV